MRHHRTHFYDSANPSAVPSGVLAIVYINLGGSFDWSDADIDRMKGVIGISESGNPANMRNGRIVAVEKGAAIVSEVPACLDARAHFGHHDAWVYHDQADWEAVEQTCIDSGHDPEFYVAAPGMSMARVLELESPIRHKKPIAVQNFWGNAFDMSVLLKRTNFTNPAAFRAVG